MKRTIQSQLDGVLTALTVVATMLLCCGCSRMVKSSESETKVSPGIGEISDAAAEEICRKSLEQSFSDRLFERVEIQRRADAISVILQDAGLPSGADSFTRYHFSLDPMTGSIVDDAVEIIENR